MRNIQFASILGVPILLFTFIQKNESPPAPLMPVPTEQQLAWHEMEVNAFVHFTTNTFTGLEWGFGDEDPGVFNPTELNPDQWVKTLKESGIKGLILTCKHHDGFCLWPSKYTDHSVKNSPYKSGKGDVVKEVAEACLRNGLKFGVYLSPWDRNHAEYGKPGYIQYYRNQLRELFTSYGPIFEMWFDGANGGNGFYGGSKETRMIDRTTYYDWPSTLNIVRELQSSVLFFSDAGPDIRWCGNEAGRAGETNWCNISNDTLYAGMPNSEKILNTGSENGTKWIPAEVDVSIRPGWFYHPEEDAQVKSPEKLFEIYLTSVGRGSTLLLNIPPDKRGLFHENDVRALKGLKKLIDQEFKNNLAMNAQVKASSYRGKSGAFSPSRATDGNKETYWTTNDEITTANIEISFGKNKVVKYVLLQEYIKLGQRVKLFTVEIWKNNAWNQVADGTTIGYKRIMKINPTQTQKIRINIKASKACPVISNIAVY